MQDHTILKNGQELMRREFVEDDSRVELARRLEQMHRKAIREPGTVSVCQRIVNLNELCPCGSGKKFKFCCRCKVNKGSFQVESRAKK